jgi:nucleoside-diphosphate-sugar epimerase
VNNALGKGFRNKALVALNRDIKFDLCWDGDIVEAFRLALGYNRSDAFNLTGGAPLTMDEMGRISGKKVIHPNPTLAIAMLKIGSFFGKVPEGTIEWAKTGLSGSINVSAERARERLGWKPRFDSSETLVEYLKHAGGGA